MVNKTLEYNIINVLDGQINKSDTLALDVSNDNANYIIHRALEHHDTHNQLADHHAKSHRLLSMFGKHH